MPTDTFFNLPDEKRERILEAALDEFARCSYYQARITAIVEEARIAKGSFYQYFADKKDLFKYIMDKAVNKKLEYINYDMMVNKEKYDFFQLLREIYMSGIRFARENPRLVAIGEKLIKNKELQQEIWGEYKDTTSDFFKGLLKEGFKKGELNPELDIDLTAHLLTSLNYSLLDIIYKGGKIDIDRIEDKIESINKMIDFIENGIKKRE